MKIFNLKGTTRDIHIIQNSPFNGKQDLENKAQEICTSLTWEQNYYNSDSMHIIPFVYLPLSESKKNNNRLSLLLIKVQEQFPL